MSAREGLVTRTKVLLVLPFILAVSVLFLGIFVSIWSEAGSGICNAISSPVTCVPSPTLGGRLIGTGFWLMLPAIFPFFWVVVK